MSLTRIDPADFVFNNDAISTSCWRDENGNPVGDTETTPTFIPQPFPDGNIINYYIGNPANLQFSNVIINKTSNSSLVARKAYGQFSNIILGDKNANFKWGGASKTFLRVISISKNSLRSSLLPGSLRIGNLTDNSNMSPPEILNCGRAYKIIEGDILPGGGFSFGRGTNSTEYGLFLPDVGLILLEAFNFDLFPFVLSNLNPTPTNHVFIRARNTEYNYSTNPSFISGSSGYIINQDWFSNPQTYITTVGLYNDNNELMATAKLPRPYNKNFNNELLIQVGLNF